MGAPPLYVQTITRPSFTLVRVLVTATCPLCDRQVDLTDEATYLPVRINGDSRFGYEPWHRVCPA